MKAKKPDYEKFVLQVCDLVDIHRHAQKEIEDQLAKENDQKSK